MRVDTHETRGDQGERIAERYLDERGLITLSRNWRCRDGELDLVATDGLRLVVVEVKTRKNDGHGPPAAHVTPVKAARVRRATADWLRHYRLGWVEIRFDVVSVLWPAGGEPTVTHMRGAF